MAALRSAYRGCLLGLAVGDAMGYPVDRKNWREIRADYGPAGLLGYDLTEDRAVVTAHTQLCAFTCNGLLLGLTRERLRGRMAPYARYIALSQKEWANTQRRSSALQRTYCWVCWVEEFRRRRCGDSRILDTLARDHIGSPEEPINRLDGPDSLTAAVAVGIFARHAHLERLGAEAVALTCGHPDAFLSGALTAELVAGVLGEPELPLEDQARRAMDTVEARFAGTWSRTHEVLRTLEQALTLAGEDRDRRQCMEDLICENAPQVLAGAVYALLTCGDDFDTAMITAVNHSGRSGAVASLVGAVMGARLGVEALPEFYLESLEGGAALVELADDMYAGCPSPVDLDWDRKYLQGER